VDATFFEQVRDAFEGFVIAVDGELHATAHRHGLKVWYGEALKEHYEAQLIRVGGELRLEIGFHTEYPKAPANDAVLARLSAHEAGWRRDLGDEAVMGAFLGHDSWRRISEVWEPPSTETVDDVIEVAARLADYVTALEPIRTAST
jgi:hypothetical protein